MITAMVSAVLLLVLPIGALHCSHDKVRAECTVCAEETSAVHEQITRLESCSGWMARRRAARALRKYDWKCSPGGSRSTGRGPGERRLRPGASGGRGVAGQNATVPSRGSRGGRPGGEVRLELADPLLGQESTQVVGQGLRGDLFDLRPRQRGRGGRCTALGPAFDAFADGFRGRTACHRAQMIVPGNSSEVSPFSPGVSPPLPSPAPGSASLLRPAPGRGPVLEGPSLATPFAFPGPRPNLAGAAARGVTTEPG